MKRVKSASAKGKQKVDDARSEEIVTYFNNVHIPLEVTSQILLNLPIKSILKCRFVCKNWNKLVSSQAFANLLCSRSPVGFLIRTANCELVSRTLHVLDGYETEFNQEVIKAAAYLQASTP